MEERRKNPRNRTYKAAEISFAGRNTAIDCVVKNVSDGGAGLDVASPIGIPDEFDLVMTGDHTTRHCWVVWRKAKKIGVRFS
jgi:hypothetical protein